MGRMVLTGDLVILADHLECPVMIPVTAGGKVRIAVDEVVGESNALAGVETEHIVLTARASGLVGESVNIQAKMVYICRFQGFLP